MNLLRNKKNILEVNKYYLLTLDFKNSEGKWEMERYKNYDDISFEEAEEYFEAIINKAKNEKERKLDDYAIHYRVSARI